MKFSRLILLVFLCLLALAWFPRTAFWKKQHPLPAPHRTERVRAGVDPEKLQEKAAEARNFIRQKGFNPRTCFLIDMSLPSGQNRFFVYDLQKDSLLRSGLVAHGNCFESWLEGRRYSNEVGSGCTSLGRYRIGASYTGKWGYSYRLHGLDSTNSRALERTVVLHAHSCVSETETTDEICQSNGCPTVSPNMLVELKKIINGSSRPVLLWIYE